MAAIPKLSEILGKPTNEYELEIKKDLLPYLKLYGRITTTDVKGLFYIKLDNGKYIQIDIKTFDAIFYIDVYKANGTIVDAITSFPTLSNKELYKLTLPFDLVSKDPLYTRTKEQIGLAFGERPLAEDNTIYNNTIYYIMITDETDETDETDKKYLKIKTVDKNHIMVFKTNNTPPLEVEIDRKMLETKYRNPRQMYTHNKIYTDLKERMKTISGTPKNRINSSNRITDITTLMSQKKINIKYNGRDSYAEFVFGIVANHYSITEYTSKGYSMTIIQYYLSKDDLDTLLREYEVYPSVAEGGKRPIRRNTRRGKKVSQRTHRKKYTQRKQRK